jgi:DNA-binding CsgD family transcriptional regulator
MHGKGSRLGGWLPLPAVQAARDAFARRSWREAYTVLMEAGEDLDAEMSEILAVAAYLIGREQDCVRGWERAHVEHLRAGRSEEAARCACWAALTLLLAGEAAQGGGWMARADRIVGELGDGHAPAARGMLLIPVALGAIGEGDAATARAVAEQMVTFATASHDRDLLALARLSAGQAELVAGDVAQSMRMFDEVMVGVTMGDVSPLPAGIIYCAVVAGCMEACDVRRAAEWTEALRRWCDSQPDLVPFRGQCLVHRSQVLLANGSWDDAAAEADRACEQLADPAHPALGLACYQRAELHRLRGELDAAADLYREASRHGHEPAPGFALMRLAEGDIVGAVRAARRMLDEHALGTPRAALLAAAVEIHLAAGEVAEGRRVADQLATLASTTATPLVGAAASYARGTVVLAEGDPAAAIAALRDAWKASRDLEMPYEAARARFQLALAYRAVDDRDAADIELDAARATFESLGASVDLAKFDASPTTTAVPARAGGLTNRECEVLRLVAAGKTNREIAAELVISEHTVSRHLQNLFMKLGVTSRAAATAYAYEHDLV